jgi:hypothetical protein
MEITEQSKQTFLKYAKDAGNWSGTPMLDGDKSENGNLTQLKQAGLITTQKDDENHRVTWVDFTDKGVELALTFGIDIASYRHY